MIKLETILIVEDDAILCELMQNSLLRTNKYNVVTERSLLMGVRKAHKTNPHCVILDLGLPDVLNVKGMDVFRYFMREVPESTIVIVTGTQGLGVQAITEGAMDYLEKPFPIGELVARVDLAIARAAVRPYHQPVKEQFDKVMQTIEQKKQNDSRDPDSARTRDTVARSGFSTVKMLIAIAALMTAFYCGVEVREQSMQRQSVRIGSYRLDQLDAKLAELRTRPTLATVAWFDSEPVDPRRRADVLPALRVATKHPNKSVSFTAKNAAARWEE